MKIIRQAVFKDLDDIIYVVSKTVEEMKSYNNHQWDSTYPTGKDFLKDIENEDLFVCEKNGIFGGFICINSVQPVEYAKLPWSLDEDCLVLHRMAVNPNLRRQGIATELVNFAEDLAVKNGITYLKTDTNSLNIKMQNLFNKFNYKFIGKVCFEGKNDPFVCYEKIKKQF